VGGRGEWVRGGWEEEGEASGKDRGRQEKGAGVFRRIHKLKEHDLLRKRKDSF